MSETKSETKAKKKTTAKKKSTRKKSSKASKKALEVTHADVDLYVQRVVGTLKGGVDVELGAHTLIVGDNGSGKSAIVNHVQLATESFIGDVVGRRQLKLKSALMAAAPERKGTLEARAFLSNGQEASYKATKRGAKISKPKESRPPSVEPGEVFPLENLYNAVLGEAKTTQKFFFKHACQKLKPDDVQAEIPSSLQLRFSEIAPRLDPDPAGALLDAVETARKRKRDLSAEVKAAKTTIEKTSEGLAPARSAEEFETLEAEITRLKQSFEAESSIATQKALQSELAALETQKQQIEEALNAAASGPASGAEASLQFLEALDTVLGQCIAHQLARCALCNTEVSSGQYALQKAKVDQNREAFRAQAQAALDAREQKGALQERLASTEARINIVKAQVSEAPVSEVASPETLTQLRDQITALERAHAEELQVRAAWKVVNKARDTQLTAERALEEVSQLVTVCEMAVTKLLDKAVAAFAQRVQGYLPRTDDFEILLEEDGKNVFQFGLVKNGVLHTLLSGAEWARVTAALACVIAADTPGELKVVVPEDRAFYPTTLTKVLEAFAAVPYQVIITHPTPPDQPVAGWTVIDAEDLPPVGDVGNGKAGKAGKANGAWQVEAGAEA